MESNHEISQHSMLSNWLIGSLAGVLAILGFLTYQATGPKHRHLIDGVMLAHDHATIGVHEHAAERPTQEDDGQPTQPSSGKNALFIGEVSLLLLADFEIGLHVDRPDAVERLCAPPEMGKQQSQDTYSPPRRGPPESLFTTS